MLRSNCARLARRHRLTKAVAVSAPAPSSESAMTSNSWRLRSPSAWKKAAALASWPTESAASASAWRAARIASLRWPRSKLSRSRSWTTQRDRDRADRDRGDHREAEPEAKAHGPLVGHGRAGPHSTGAFASDSQR